MASTGRAFCPGHVTGFFQVCEDADPLKMGSRGAGFCVSKGVTTEVRVKPASEASVEVRINGERAAAVVTETAVIAFLDDSAEVRVDSTVGLPISQGFGMSGAGALSTLLAMDEATGAGHSKEDLISLAHRSEVLCRTGLGDVFPQLLGGFDVREHPGAPPYGRVRQIHLESEVVLCVLGPPMATRTILTNDMAVRSINGVGKRCVDRFLKRMELDYFFHLAWLFARQTVLATSEVQGAVLKAGLYGTASMCMLGNSIFAIGKADELERALREHGEVFRVDVDNEGARVL